MGHNATVYNLKPKEWNEVSLMKDIDEFDNPMTFMNTGFEYNTSIKTFKSNISHTLGLQRPFPADQSKGLYRAFSEMELI